MVDARIERVRIDANYKYGFDVSMDSSFDSVAPAAQIFKGKPILKSTYVDVYEYGEYVVDTSNIEGRQRTFL